MPMESLPLLPPLVTLPPPTITELAGTCLSGQRGLVTCQHPLVHYVLCNLGPCFMHYLFLIEDVLLHLSLCDVLHLIYVCIQNTAHTHSECVAVARSLKTRLRTRLRLRGVSRKCLRRTAGGNTYSSHATYAAGLTGQGLNFLQVTRQIHVI